MTLMISVSGMMLKEKILHNVFLKRLLIFSNTVFGKLFYFLTALGDNFDLIFPKQTSNTMVYIPPSPAIMNLMQISIAFWIKPDIRYKQATVFTYRADGKQDEMVEISFTEKTFRVVVQKDVLESLVKILDGQWHFIGMSWGKYDNDFSIYFDGKLVGQQPIPLAGELQLQS